MAYDTAEPSGFSIGAVFARCLGTYRRRFIPFFLVTFAIVVPFCLTLSMVPTLLSLAHTRLREEDFSAVLGLLAYTVLYAAESALFNSAYSDMSGQAIALGRSVRRGFARLPIVVLAVAIVFIAVIIGSMGVIFPGIMIFTMTAVTVPACVIERLGPFAAMSRSTALTKGHRWRILAIYLVEIVGGYGGFLRASTFLDRILPSYLAIIIMTGLSVALVAFVTVLNTAVYFELCAAKEGGPTDPLAAVFD